MKYEVIYTVSYADNGEFNQDNLGVFETKEEALQQMNTSIMEEFIENRGFDEEEFGDVLEQNWVDEKTWSYFDEKDDGTPTRTFKVIEVNA